MHNVSRSDKFGIQIDLDKSHDSFLFNNRENREILDFFGMYASCPLGYNHAIFKTEEFKREILKVSHTKISNCVASSDVSLEFDKLFSKFSPKRFPYKYYCCTGSLAVEAGIKTALESYNASNPKVITFPKSFHGGNAWGSFFTSRDAPVDFVLEGYPKTYALECQETMSAIQEAYDNFNIAAVLIEPLRSTFGDIKFDKEFLKDLNEFCKERNIPIIVDEVQTGMGSTGTYWFYEQLPIIPDILIFGKKSQLSGIMVTEEFSHIFKQDGCKLEVTWDATLFDMVRCKHILKAYEDLNILSNVRERAHQLITGIKNPKVRNLRNEGLLVAFDFNTEIERNEFQTECYAQGLFLNKAGTNTIRLRPNLAVKEEEIDLALQIIN